MSIPVQLVDEDFLRDLEVVMAAAEASSSSCKKAKISPSRIAHLSVPCVLPSGGTECAIGHHLIAFKEEASASSRSLEKAFAAPAAEKVYGHAHNTETPFSSRLLETITAVEDGRCGKKDAVHDGQKQCKDGSLEAPLSSRLLETIAAVDAGYHEKKDAIHNARKQCKDKFCVGVLSGSKEEVCFANAHKEEASDKSSLCENTTSMGLADNAQMAAHGNEHQRSLNLRDTIPTRAPISANNKLPWMLASCYYRVKEGNLPYLQFEGQIKYSNTPLDAEKAAYELLRQIEAKKATCGGSVPLGFDAEWKVIDEQAQKVAVLQLCMDAGSCNVFHVIYTGIPSPLRIILEDPSVFKVDKNKSIRMGDWEQHILSEAQLQYAAIDAFASLSIFKALSTNWHL